LGQPREILFPLFLFLFSRASEATLHPGSATVLPGPGIDPKSNAGKPPVVSEVVPLLIVGAGPAGLAAAIEAVSRRLPAVVIDESPIPHAVMGDEVPQYFGQGMTGAVRNRTAMLEAFIASEPLIERAFEAGVDLRFGTACWGLYANRPGLSGLPGLVAGVVDDTGARLLQAGRVIVATGRRDMGLAFPGWQLPGVMGASAARLLAGRYADALMPRDIVILGSGVDALTTARVLAGNGVRIQALVEQAAEPIGPPDLIQAVEALGIPILCRHCIREARGSAHVEGVMLHAIDPMGGATGVARELACDGVVLAVGAVPMIDLLDAAGARCGFDALRGGHVPVLDMHGETGLAGVYAVGDCAGIWPEKTRDPRIAEAEGIHAAQAILGEAAPIPLAPSAPETDLSSYRQAWVRASVIEAGQDVLVCQCEDVSARDLLELRPPRYLCQEAQHRPNHTLADLIASGTPDPDQIKRLTRAGMGPCQGRRCREQIAALLALQGSVPLSAVPLARYRAPVRPLPLGVAGLIPEVSAQSEHWDSWFGMHAQWRPFWEVPETFTLARNDTRGEVASE
jgi:thioredoxin reductase